MALLGSLDAGTRDESAFQKWLKQNGVLGAGAAPTVGPAGGGAALTAPAPVDYQSLISNDPIFGQLKSDLSAQGVGDAASRGSAVARGLVQFGLVPDFNSAAQSLGLSSGDLGFLGQDVTDGVKQLADKNTNEGLSISARLRDAYQQNQKQIKDSLAARGMAGSGESGYLLGRAAQGYKQAQSDAMQQLADYIRQAYGSFATSERDRQRQLGDAASAAAERQRSLLGDTPPPAPAPGPAPAQLRPDPSPAVFQAPDGYAPGGVSYLPRRSLVNPYTTGRKRFG